MSTVISRRSFLKCTGASAAALGAVSLLGGCKSNGSDTVVEVKVGDTVRNWNGLGVQLTSVFHLTQDPVQPAGYEYLGRAGDHRQPQQDRELRHRRTGH